jgi:hypothetical protein
MVCDAGDSTERVVGVGTGSVDLADDRVFGSRDTRQRRHRRHHAVTAGVPPNRIERPRRIR